MPGNFYIAIEGAIGVGKTTLARLLGHELCAELLLEVFEENPFLSDFYADRARYAFQTQIFFLLSRYRQQHKVIQQTLTGSPLISDYTFAKDRLFAELNLANDELEMYRRVHGILAEKISPPDLVIYLRASTDVLLERIAVRDRTYERGMSREYIERLHTAYERFFADYAYTPMLAIDTDTLDYVRNAEALAYVIGRVRSALAEGDYQRPLPQLDDDFDAAEILRVAEIRRHLPDFQRWHRALDVEKGFLTDLYFNYIALTEEMGELGRTLKKAWRARDALYVQVGNHQEAQERALREHLPAIREELADLLAYILKLSNYAGIDLEEAYLEKMCRNQHRVWHWQTSQKPSSVGPDSPVKLNAYAGKEINLSEKHETITVMIEIPKGSRNKYEYDEEKQMLKFDRMLFSAVHYPSDYGFIPETLAQDGDPLDALVLVWEPTFPGCIIETKPVGVFKMWDEKGMDDKILCVPIKDPLWNYIENLSTVPPHLLKEIEHFFSIYKDLEEKKTGIEGWEDRESAIEIIREAEQRYKEHGS